MNALSHSDALTADADEHDRSFDEYHRSGARPTLTALVEVYRLARPFWHGLSWLAPLVLLFGLIASAAEGLGVGAVLVMLAVLTRGGHGEIEAESPLLGRVTEHVTAWSGGSITLIIGFAVALIVIRIIVVEANMIVANLIEGRISDRVRRALFRSVVTMDYDAISRRPYGDVLTALDRHSWTVAEATDGFVQIVLNLVVSVAIGALLLVLAPGLAAVAIAGTLILTFALRWIETPAERAGEAAAAAARAVSRRSIRVLQAMRTVRAYGQERPHRDAFAIESDDLRRMSLRSDLISGIAEPASHVAYLAMLAAIVAVSIGSGMSHATLLASVGLLYRLQPYVSSFESARLHLATLLGPLRVVTELVASAPAEDDPPTHRYDGLKQGIRFDRVWFGYPGQAAPCLREASFVIPCGGWTAITGDSGTGKSTLINLLLRFYSADAGRILIDGQPLDMIRTSAWLDRCSIAGQDVELIDGSIRDNILIGRSDADPTALAHAVDIAGLDDLIAGMPAGLDTMIGERGTHLSGGQRQRIGLARALIRKPELLILDEATSALDRASESIIFARLAQAMRGRTVIIIGHHLDAALPIGTTIRLDQNATPSAWQEQGPADGGLRPDA